MHSLVVSVLFIVAIILLVIEWVIVNLVRQSMPVNLTGFAWILIACALYAWHSQW